MPNATIESDLDAKKAVTPGLPGATADDDSIDVAVHAYSKKSFS